MSAETPHSARGWLKDLSINGPRNRPFPTDNSDLLDPQGYGDPFDIKAERAGLAAIFSIRAYQFGKKMLLAQELFLSSPPSRSLDSDGLVEKNAKIASTFKEAIARGVRRDELRMEKLPSETPIVGAYKRLTDILEPVVEITMQHSEKTFERKPHPVSFDVLGGLEALPSQMHILLGGIWNGYTERFGKEPDIETVLSIMNNSYYTYIRSAAVLHKADAYFVSDLHDKFMEAGDFMGVTELEESDGTLSLALKPAVTKSLATRRKARSEGKPISRTTTCSFLVPAQDVIEYLDEVPDFGEPLKDAFDLHMRFLAA